MTTPIENIGQVAIRARDLEASVAFYRDTLGPRLPVRRRPARVSHVRRRPADARGARERQRSTTRARRSTSACPTYRPRTRSCGGRGVEFVDEPHLIAKLPDHELWMAFFRDPDGNLMGLMSEVRD